MPNDRANLSSRLNSVLSRIAQMTVTDLVGAKRLGSMENFQGGSATFQNAIELAKVAHNLPFQKASVIDLRTASKPANTMLDVLNKVLAFPQGHRSAKGESGADVIKTLIGDSESAYDDLAKSLMPLTGHLGWTVAPMGAMTPDVATTKERLSDLRQAGKDSAEILEVIKNCKKEVVDLHNKYKYMIQVGTTGMKGKQFGDAAKDHQLVSNIWLFFAVFAIVITCLIAAYWVNWFSVDEETKMLNFWNEKITIQLIVSRVVILSLLLFTVGACVRNHQTNRHLFVQNRHRQNVMVSFEVLVAATEDPKLQARVLIEAVRTIFDPGTSGFLAASKDLTAKNVVNVVEKKLAGGS